MITETKNGYFIKLAWKNKQALSDNQRMEILYRLLPYLFFPNNKKLRSEFDLRISEDINEQLKSKPKLNTTLSAIQLSTKWKIILAKRTIKPHKAKGLIDFLKIANSEIRSLYTVHKIVELLIAQSRIEGLPYNASKQSCESILISKYYQSVGDKLSFKDKGKIDVVWNKYKRSAHLIFGFFYTIKPSELNFKKKKPFRDALVEIISHSLYAQDFLINHRSHGKHVMVKENSMWKLSQVKWASAKNPDNIEPLAKGALDAIEVARANKSKYKKNMRDGEDYDLGKKPKK